MNNYISKAQVIKELERFHRVELNKINPNLFEDRDVAFAYCVENKKGHDLNDFFTYTEKTVSENKLRKNKSFMNKIIGAVEDGLDKPIKEKSLMKIIAESFDKNLWMNETVINRIINININDIAYLNENHPELITFSLKEMALDHTIQVKGYNIRMEEIFNEDELIYLYKKGIPDTCFYIDNQTIDEKDMLRALKSTKALNPNLKDYPIVERLQRNICYAFYEKAKRIPSCYETAAESVIACPDLLKFESFKSFKNDVSFLLDVIEKNPHVYEYIDDSLKQSDDILRTLIGHHEFFIFDYEVEINQDDHSRTRIYPLLNYKTLKIYAECIGKEKGIYSLADIVAPWRLEESKLSEEQLFTICKIAVLNKPSEAKYVPDHIVVKAFELLKGDKNYG